VNCEGNPEADELDEETPSCHCGNSIMILHNYEGTFDAFCEKCLDPCEDAGPSAQLVGNGPTAGSALLDWTLRHQELFQ
jgi:hypothetical protein